MVDLYFDVKLINIEKEKKGNVSITWCSQAVTHPSTNHARRCLTSVIGRELVLSPWYERWRQIVILKHHIFTICDPEPQFTLLKLTVWFILSTTSASHEVHIWCFDLTVSRQRSYHGESTSSRPITEVKHRRAWLVLGWVTAWEHHVLLTFYVFLPFQKDLEWFIFLDRKLSMSTTIPRWKYQFSSDHWS